jgi:hypothetical protein
MNKRNLGLTAALLGGLALAACNSGTSNADGSGASPPPAAGEGEGAAPAQGGTEARGPVGVYTGTLAQAPVAGAPSSAEREADIAPYRGGALQMGIWEFCNLDLTGEAPAYTVAEGARCLVDLGAGRREYAAGGTATIAEGTLSYVVTFTELEGGAPVSTWTFTGQWTRTGTRSM